MSIILGQTICKNCFELKENVYSIRNILPLRQKPYQSITYGFNSISYKGALIWNKIPNEYKAAITLKEFKNVIKEWEGPKCSCNMCEKLLTNK